MQYSASMAAREGWDATTGNLWAVPSGEQAAGYTTGSGVAWTAAQWHAYPGAVRICQDDGLTDDTADVADVERFAGTPAQAGDWYQRATAAWNAGRRPGQRKPAIYTSFDNIANVGKGLAAAKVKGTPRLFVAYWGIGLSGALAMLERNIGSYYIVGVQYENRREYDADVFNSNWLDLVSAEPKQPAPVPVTDWTAAIVDQLPTLKQGDTGPGVRTVQALLVARYFHVGTTGDVGDGVDGDYGPLTDAAIRTFQGEKKIKVTGITDQLTWPALLGV